MSGNSVLERLKEANANNEASWKAKYEILLADMQNATKVVVDVINNVGLVEIVDSHKEKGVTITSIPSLLTSITGKIMSIITRKEKKEQFLSNIDTLQKLYEKYKTELHGE